MSTISPKITVGLTEHAVVRKTPENVQEQSGRTVRLRLRNARADTVCSGASSLGWSLLSL